MKIYRTKGDLKNDTKNERENSGEASFRMKFGFFLVFGDLFYSQITWFVLNFYATSAELSIPRIVIFSSKFLLGILVWAFGRSTPFWKERTLGFLFIIIFLGNFIEKLLSHNFFELRRAYDLGLIITFHIGFVTASRMSRRISLTVIMIILLVISGTIPFFFEDSSFIIYLLTSTNGYALLAVILCIITLKAEELPRKSLKKSINSSENILKALLKDILPWSIVIATEDRVLYANQSATKIFASGKVSLFDSIQKVKLREKDEEFRVYKQEKYLMTSPHLNFFNKSQDSPDIQVYKKQKRKSQILLHKVISEAQGSLKEADGSGILKFYGTFLACNSDNEDKSFNNFSGLSNSIEKKYFDITITGIEWEETPAKLIIFCEDDMIRNLKELKRQSKFKDQMLATVGHNLRTPLNGIFGMLSSQNIKRTPENSELIKSQKYTKKFADILLHTIKDIENYNLFVLGRLHVDPQLFSLSEKIKSIIKLYRFQAKRKGVLLEFENRLPAINQSDYIENDLEMFNQVVFNLISNAIKFTNRGHVKVVLDVKQQSDFDATGCHSKANMKIFLIRVEDSGLGIKPGQKAKLFKLFSRSSPRNGKLTGQPLNGIGLGLTMSQIQVKLMNNHKPGLEINLESDFAQGSIFEFPIVSNPKQNSRELDVINWDSKLIESKIDVLCDHSFHESAEQMSECVLYGNVSERMEQSLNLNKYIVLSRSPFPKTSSDSDRVLLVDDDQINIIVGENYLKQLGYVNRYDVALNGQEAYERVRKLASLNKYYKFILMDCNMPIMDGFEATLKIQELHSRQNFPRAIIIASTANHSQQDLARINECGMLGCLIKPYKKEDLQALLLKLIKS